MRVAGPLDSRRRFVAFPCRSALAKAAMLDDLDRPLGQDRKPPHAQGRRALRGAGAVVALALVAIGVLGCGDRRRHVATPGGEPRGASRRSSRCAAAARSLPGDAVHPATARARGPTASDGRAGRNRKRRQGDPRLAARAGRAHHPGSRQRRSACARARRPTGVWSRRAGSACCPGAARTAPRRPRFTPGRLSCPDCNQAGAPRIAI